MARDWGSFEDLAPFISFVVLRHSGKLTPHEAADALKSVLRSQRRTSFSAVKSDTRPTGDVARFHYIEKRPPSWLSDDATVTIEDVRHHIVLVYKSFDLFAVHCSENSAASRIIRVARANPSRTKGMKPVAAKRLEEALAWGAARTLWLSTVQRQSGQRADRKVLAGLDLTYALDPLEDQGYAFSSARCDHSAARDGKAVVGVSPPRARVWSGPAESLDEFASAAQTLLANIATPSPPDVSFRSVLAARESTRQVKEAFEVAILHPDLDQADTHERELDIALRREWAEEAEICVTPLGGAAFDLTVDGLNVPCTLHGDMLKEEIAVTCAAGHTSDHDPCADARRVLGTPAWIAVRYASGHTWIAGERYEMRLRPVVFEPDFAPIDEDSFNIHEEKPCRAEKPKTPGAPPRLNKNGEPALAKSLDGDKLIADDPSDARTKKSLFNWIVHERPPEILPNGGWLMCDDGAGERADFIHADLNARVVRLIHVKACHSRGTGVSLNDFELVVAQAVKNLRWMNLVELAEVVRAPSPNVEKLVWPPLAHPPLTAHHRERFAGAIGSLGDNYTRRVVIVQPALSAQGWANGKPVAKQLLSTLLWSARMNSQGLNAELKVVGRT